MISAILFDFGGTLDADGLHWLDRFYAIYTHAGLSDVPKPLIKEAFYWADAQAELDPAMKKAGLREMMDRHAYWQLEKLGRQNAQLAQTLSEGFYKPVEKVLRRNRHILEKLSHRGFRLGVISNFYGNVGTLCHEFGFSPLLDIIIDSAEVGVRKPDPAIFHLAISHFKVPPSEIAFVGDSFERDIVPAKALGMQTYWLVGDHNRNAVHDPRADRLLFSLEDLPQYLKEARPGSQSS